METQSIQGGNGGKGGRILVVVGVIVIIALLAVIVALLMNRGNETPEPQEADTGSTREVLVTEDNLDEVIEQMEEAVAPGSYEVTMNTDWTFPSGKSTSPNAYVENSTANTNAVYFDVYRSDTNDIIYSSPIMPVGSVLDEITIDTDLAAGTYDCVMTYHLVDEEYRDLSEVSMQVTVTIEN